VLILNLGLSNFKASFRNKHVDPFNRLHPKPFLVVDQHESCPRSIRATQNGGELLFVFCGSERYSVSPGSDCLFVPPWVSIVSGKDGLEYYFESGVVLDLGTNNVPQTFDVPASFSTDPILSSERLSVLKNLY
jgi:hypothetical protein